MTHSCWLAADVACCCSRIDQLLPLLLLHLQSMEHLLLHC
jgi:hypothetical protein